MFKTMRRFKQQLSQEKCIEILTNEPHGVLSLISDTGYPYGFPITHWYDEKTGNIYFHGAKEGHKMDCLKQCDKASFCVMDKGFKKDGEWAIHYQSVIVFGKIKLVLLTTLRAFRQTSSYSSSSIKSVKEDLLNKLTINLWASTL